MKEYDVLVIGSGAGAVIVDEAVGEGLKVAMVDKGPLGGTCMNLGCIPTKILIYPADVVAVLQEAEKLGIRAEVKSVDFKSIMHRMRKSRQESQDYVRRGIEEPENLDLYEGEGHFVDDHTLEVKGERVKGKLVFIASGSRPLVPRLKGLDDVDFLTSDDLLELDERPDSLIVVGGGYIAVEYAHFFAAMGTRVTLLEMLERLVQGEEPEVADVLAKSLARRMSMNLGMRVEEVRGGGDGCVVTAREVRSGKMQEFTAEKVLLAVGRISNADLLKVENTGVELDPSGFIKVDEYLETTKRDIFAVGDANGKQMFLHVANREAEIAWHNSRNRRRKRKMDYSAAPHAIYSHPQIASVGLTQEQAAQEYHVMVGKARYWDTAKGEAMMEQEGFAKAIVDAHSGKILGFHIVGPHAPILIQEVINAMAKDLGVRGITEGMHIHPALPELILTALGNLEEVEERG